MPFRKLDLDFVVFFSPLVLCEVSYGSPSEVLVTHLTSSVISPRLMCSGRLTWTPLFQKMKSMSGKQGVEM